ncbi:12131_t:CDS:2 [Ambispora gerdemannii]|uniref:Kynureninase n=1 Tax=Ambispora gerdemannii TaxID=144530 RepID=A0A9N8UW91_9GLOM|nr:12131_t:CDS:2 [Ambispora gerdemannii]
MREIHQLLKDVKLQLHELKDVHESISKLAGKADLAPTSLEFAQNLDKHDDLSHLRQEFQIPKVRDVVSKGTVLENANDDAVYIASNSIGLLSKRSRELINEEIDVWATRGELGFHTHPHDRPWDRIDETVISKLATLIGAKPVEVAVKGDIKTNLSNLLTTFYTPTKDRHKILIEHKASPTDMFSVDSQIKSHGYDPAESILKVESTSGRVTTENPDILNLINKEGDTISVVFLGAVNYYTGQLFHLEKITKAAHKKGCVVILDLAHAIGNIVLKLHDWKIDCATWSSEKYLNAGPGSVSGIFIHEKYARDFEHSRFAALWGYKKETRLKMEEPFDQPSALYVASLLGSLEVFAKTNLWDLRTKSILLTGYLEFLLSKLIGGAGYEMLTPRDTRQRGAQISIKLTAEDKNLTVIKKLADRGFVVDGRKSGNIVMAPVPLYNTYMDVWKLAKALKEVLAEIQ